MILARFTDSSLRGVKANAKPARKSRKQSQNKRLLRPKFRPRSNDGEWKYIDRGYRESIILIPGWATDYRIFDSLDIYFNYLLPVEFSPFDFNKALKSFISKNNIKKINIMGWSLGGFLAAGFACAYPELINRLFLVSIRKKYKPEEIITVKELLKKSKAAYLYKFYMQCFLSKEKFLRFKQTLFKDYCNGFGLNYLLETLEFLAGLEMMPEMLRGINNIKLIHGGRDCIAPVEEALWVKENLRDAGLIRIKDAGHMPLFSEDFSALTKKTRSSPQ